MYLCALPIFDRQETRRGFAKMSVNTSGQDCLYSIQPVPVPVVTSPSTSSCGGSPKARDVSVSQFPTPTTMSGGDYSGQNSRGENRRGRPRSESLTTLMIEGSTSPSSIKCKFCNRVFPREKSLAAHLRTHTGQSPRVSYMEREISGKSSRCV